MKPLIFLAISLLIFLVTSAEASDFESHHQYKTSKIRDFQSIDGNYVLEKARVNNGTFIAAGIERIQLSDKNGSVLAYTPTRITAIPFCFWLQECYVYMWKTVYPLPAIYKLDVQSLSPLDGLGNPPMRYSRSGPGGENFTEVTNPVTGVFGLFLLLAEKLWFFLGAALIGLILALQLSRYREWQVKKKHGFVFNILMRIIFLPLPIVPEPYFITCGIILVYTVYGALYAGVPIVLSVFTVFLAFFITCMRLARIKREQLDPSSKKNRYYVPSGKAD